MAYASSDRVQMLSHLPELSHADQRHLEALSYRYMLRPGKFPQKSNQKYDDAVLERLYYDIQKENNAFTRDIRPFDLLRPSLSRAIRTTHASSGRTARSCCRASTRTRSGQ